MLSRFGKRVGVSSGIGYYSKRCIVISPAVNDLSQNLFPAVLPMGFDFVSDELRGILESRNVDVDDLERRYNNQIQNDAEFNNAALPRQGSALWGYIYANRLVRAKVQLDTLIEEEEYMKNYLRATVAELEQRMNRYYPNLDWQGEYEAELARTQAGTDDSYETAKIHAIADIVSREGGDDAYVSLFANNSFIDKYDENDKFSDFLPASLEEQLIRRFEFYFDHSSNTVDPSKYFSSLQKIEKTIETPLNALSKELRQNFGSFMLGVFGSNDLSLASNIIDTITSASSLIVTDDEASVSKCLSLLDLKSGKVSNASADVLARLFFGNTESSKQLNGKDVNEVSAILASAGQERISLIYSALQIESCLKQNGVARLLLSLVISLNRDFSGQLLSNPENIDAFVSANGSLMDTIVSSQKAFSQSQEKLSQALTKFVDNLVGAIAKDRKVDKEGLTRVIRESILSDSLPSASTNVTCVIIQGLRAYAEASRDSGDTFGELKGLTYSKYLELSGASVGWYTLFNGLINPPRNGLTGRNLARIADVVANDSSTANEIIFGSVGNYLQQNGLLNDSESGSIASSLSSSVSGDLDALKSASNEFDKARIEIVNALKSVTLNTDGINFEHIVDTFDPLNVHLAAYRYLTPN